MVGVSQMARTVTTEDTGFWGEWYSLTDEQRAELYINAQVVQVGLQWSPFGNHGTGFFAGQYMGGTG